MAKVSVVLPVFNGGHQFHRSLECIVNQTFTDLEILILDNASTDETPEIISSYAKYDTRIIAIRQSKNIGAAGNFNDGLLRATGEYLTFRAHDDVSSPDYIERLVCTFKMKTKAVLAVGSVKRILPNGREQWIVPSANHSLSRWLIGSASSWFYGVWRRDYLTRRLAQIFEVFPYA